MSNTAEDTTEDAVYPIYPFGTNVWVKIYNRIFWPGTIVADETIPKDLKDFKDTVKGCLAIVKFKGEDKYEIVNNKNKILLYSCDLKTNFISRGIKLSELQQRGEKIVGNCDMGTFFSDIASIERDIGGDVNIVKHIKMEKIKQTKTVKELFSASSSKKPKKKVESRKSLSALTPTIQPKIVKIPPIRVLSVPKSEPKSRRKCYKTPTPVKTYKSVGTSISGYRCYSKVGCNFTTNSYDLLKRHIQLHKKSTPNKADTAPSKTPPSNKRKNAKTKSPDSKKKLKLQDEILEDWNDEDEVIHPSIVVPTTIELVESKNEVTATSNNVILAECEPSTSAIMYGNDHSSIPVGSTKVVDTTSENTNSPDKVFDFNENDGNTPVLELRQRSNSGSTTEDDDNETFELQLTEEFINKTIFKETTKKTLSTEQLLENTEGTLDQINQLEQSLSDISTGVNNSDANVNVIGASEESIKSGSNKDVHKDTDGLENQSQNIYIENSEIVDIDTGITPNEDSSIIDMPIENSSSNLDSTDENVNDSEDENPTEEGNIECLETEWMQQHGWETFPSDAEIREAKFLYELHTVSNPLPTFNIELDSVPAVPIYLKRAVEDDGSNGKLISICVPKINNREEVLESLRNNPDVIQMLQKGEQLTFIYSQKPVVAATSMQHRMVMLPPKPAPTPDPPAVVEQEPMDIIDLLDSSF